MYSCEWVSSAYSGSDDEEAYWNSPKEFLKKTFVFKREKNNIAFEKNFLSSNTDLQITLNSDEVFVASSVNLLDKQSTNFVSIVYKDGNFTISKHGYLSGDVVVNTKIAKCYIPQLD